MRQLDVRVAKPGHGIYRDLRRVAMEGALGNDQAHMVDGEDAEEEQVLDNHARPLAENGSSMRRPHRSASHWKPFGVNSA